MKAIIVAAGRGRRLGPETAEIPKCMVAVAGRPILHRQMDALSAAGVRQFVVVRGYLGDRIAPPSGYSIRFVDNPEWAHNNILASLMFAETEMDDGFVFSYSDIVFATDHARLVAASEADVGLIVDRRWRQAYVGRIHHPISEAELASVQSQTGHNPHASAWIDRVGKTVVDPEMAAGEFTGLARFSRIGADQLRDEWRQALAREPSEPTQMPMLTPTRPPPPPPTRPAGLPGLAIPYGRAPSLREAYLSDALNALSRRGHRLTPLFVDGGWREIDTEEDLSRAHALVDDWNAGDPT